MLREVGKGDSERLLQVCALCATERCPCLPRLLPLLLLLLPLLGCF